MVHMKTDMLNKYSNSIIGEQWKIYLLVACFVTVSKIKEVWHLELLNCIGIVQCYLQTLEWGNIRIVLTVKKKVAQDWKTPPPSTTPPQIFGHFSVTVQIFPSHFAQMMALSKWGEVKWDLFWLFLVNKSSHIHFRQIHFQPQVFKNLVPNIGKWQL